MGALMDSPHFLAEASRDHAQEEAARLMANARIAIAPVWPTLAAAESPEDFDNRRELFAEQIAKACLAVAGNDLNAYTALLGQVQSQLEEDFNILHTAREAKKQAARKTAEHEHTWGPVEVSRFSGNPHRECTQEGCRVITLDLHDWEDEGEVTGTRKQAGVYCKDHNVWVGDGNEATHEGCSKEQKATEKTKEGKQSPPFDREVAEREAARKEAAARECPGCDGTGFLDDACSHCDGTGFLDNGKKNCPYCKGTGKQASRKQAVDQATWQRDFEKYTQAIEAAGAVVDNGDGTQGIDSSKVPPEVARGYMALVQMGYANGFLASKHGQIEHVGPYAVVVTDHREGPWRWGVTNTASADQHVVASGIAVDQDEAWKAARAAVPKTGTRKQAAWTNAWPSAPSVARPGEQTIACPKCGSIDVTMTGAYGPGGRLGDPGAVSINVCNSCGHREIMRTASRKQGWSMDQVREVLETKGMKEIDGVLIDINTANAMVQVFNALSPESQAKVNLVPIGQFGAFAWAKVGSLPKRAEDSGGKSRDDLQSMTDAQVKALWVEKSGSGETVDKLTKEMIRRGLFPPKQGKIAAFEVVDENDERVAGPFDTEEEAQGFIDQMGQDESDHGKDTEPTEEEPKKGEFPPKKDDKEEPKGKGKPPWAKGSAVEAWLRNPREGARRMAQNPYTPENNPFVPPAAPTTAPISQPGESGQVEDRSYPNEPGQPDPVTDPAEDQAIQGFSSREKVAAYAAKIAEIAEGIAQTNPSIDPREAVAIAHRTASLYPAVVAIEEREASEHEGMIDHRSRACANCGEMIYRRPGGVWLHTRTDDEKCRGKWRQKVKWTPLEPA